MEGHERRNPDWANSDCYLLRAAYWEKRCALAEQLLEHILTKKEIGRACHIHDLDVG